ncbi:MAG: glycosyltransferase [Ferruginibacter sp.]|nr:glycosyltransferase [Ferruginibacter sp.]
MELLILLVSLFLFIIYAVLIIYYRQSWLSIPIFKPTGNPVPGTKISIIIPARNEEKNIGHCLHSITNQSYPKHLFEVLVVDDHSTDNTAEIITGYAEHNVRLISLKDFIATTQINSYKKKAIEIGIRQSTGELIVTTDADCIVPANWLQTMAAFYEEKKPEFIVMPVSINCSNKFIELFQALDFMTLQGITGASVHKKFHSMCNGANLAYTKKAFNEVGGFKGIDNIASGDDMLLLHKIFNRYPNGIAYLKTKEVIVQTEPVQTIAQFLNQRIRWASKADKYEDKSIFVVLVLVYFFNVWIFLLGMAAVFYPFACYFIALIVAKTITELYFLYPVAGFFNKRIILWWFPLAQPFHILYTMVAGWMGKFGKYTWKERTVK